MDLSQLEVKLTNHAYEQYCRRVAQVAYDDLREQLRAVMPTRQYYRSYEYLQVDGVWWCYDVEGQELVMVTCYGRTDYNLPLALRWAKRNNDRIDLSKSQSLGNLDRGG